MIDLLMEHRRWLVLAGMGLSLVGLFIRQEVARRRHLLRLRRSYEAQGQKQ